jgi:hypothetical protein
MSKNSELRIIFGPNMGDMTGRWTKLYSQELCNLQAYSSPYIIRMMESRRLKWAGVEKTRNLYSNFVGKSEGREIS